MGPLSCPLHIPVCNDFSSFWFPYLRKEIILLAYRTQGLQEVIDLDIQAAFESLEHY